MDRQTFTLDQANRALPLVKAIASEIQERRALRHALARRRDELEVARTPEGLLDALSNLDARIFEQDTGIQESLQEMTDFGVEVFRLTPITIHFPGRSRSRDVVFCWQEGEELICHGHASGEESEPRRPLKVRAKQGD